MPETHHTDTKAARILLVDDEAAFCELCSLWLRQAGYQVVCAGDAETARQCFDQQPFDLVLQDLALPPGFAPEDGLSLIAHYGETPVIVLTGHADKALALEAISRGAWDFIGKPVDPDLLSVVVQRAVAKQQLMSEVGKLRRQLAEQGEDSEHYGLIGASPQISQIRALIQRIAPTEVPVLITGPSGTGKEVIANAIHRHSARRDGAFISVHCGAIPAELLESELFGYKRGAFTGADRDRKGLLALADQGTLFLDEIGEMPLAMQVKLLRVLQGGSYYPVGGREVEHINVRLVSATNRDLPVAVDQGQFRDDLYYRIKGLTITTAPLAEQPDDIPLLARHVIDEFNRRHDSGLRLGIEAVHWCCQQPWPGNVRELKNTLESIAAIAPGPEINLDDIAFICPRGSAVASMPLADGGSLDEQVRILEINLIRAALDQYANNRTRAAEHLSLSRQGLLKKMERYGLK